MIDQDIPAREEQDRHMMKEEDAGPQFHLICQVRTRSIHFNPNKEASRGQFFVRSRCIKIDRWSLRLRGPTQRFVFKIEIIYYSLCVIGETVV